MGTRQVRGGVCLATALLWLMALLGSAPSAHAAAGLLDPSFGSGGYVVLDDPAETGERLRDVAILADGRILGAGSRGGSKGFLLARLGAAGTPDAGFDGDGIKVEPYTASLGDPRSIAAIEPRADGRLVVTGLGTGTMADAYQFGRYLPGGDALDPGFGSAGLRTVAVSPSGSAFAADLAPDGKVVAVGGNGPGNKAVAVRVTEGGDPDAGFGPLPVGVRFVDVPESISEEAHAVRVLSDGSVLLGGISTDGAFLAKLDSGGLPFPGFGDAGIAVHPVGSGASEAGMIRGLEVLADGRILAAGFDFATGGEDTELFVARFTPEGSLDPSFGAGGIFRRNPTGGADEAAAMEVLPDGRILLAGQRSGGEGPPGSSDTWILRLTADGRLDQSFGGGGESVAAIPGSDSAEGMALQPDGRAVVVGRILAGSGKLLVARFTADDPPLATPIGAERRPRCRGRRATIVGTPRRERIRGTRGRDVIVALGGNDRIIAGAGNDVVCAGAGKDVVKAGKGRDLVDGGAGPDVELGEGGRDLLIGGLGAERIFGGNGPDRLFGGKGNDLTDGGRGRDLCNGGAGRRDRARRCERRRRIP